MRITNRPLLCPLVLIVDATTAEHARGIGTVIRGVIGGLAENHADAMVVAGPQLGDIGLPSRRIELARTRPGRLVYQRALLPFDAARARSGAIRADQVLLLDSYTPLFRPQTRLRYAALVHDVLPLTHPQYWSLTKRLVKRAAFASLRNERVKLFSSTEFNVAQIRQVLGRGAHAVRFGCGQLTDEEADRALASPLPSARPYLLYVGALEPRKGLHDLLDIFDLVGRSSQTELELILVGSGPKEYEAALRSKAAASKAANGIRMVGAASRPEVIELVAHARALVMPTEAEGFCIPILEAMALGTPVVASNIPSIRSWAEDAILYAPLHRPAKWVEPIWRAIESSATRRRAGQKAVRGYRWSTCAYALAHF